LWRTRSFGATKPIFPFGSCFASWSGPLCIVTVEHTLSLSQNIRSRRVQTHKTTVGGNDLYTPHYILSINSPPTHQPHSILPYPSRILYFGTFEPSRTLYFGTEGVACYPPRKKKLATQDVGGNCLWAGHVDYAIQ
jgi:hypothetical protein